MNRITILEMNIMIMMIVIMDQIEILMTTMVTIIITSMTIMNKTMWNHHIKLKNQTVVHVVKPYYNDDIDNNYRDNNFDDTTHRNDAEQDLATDTEEDKYNQYPKRAITDEYHTDANENEATGVLSRQAKYNQKSNKQSQYDNNIDEDSNDFAENVVDSEPKIDKKSTT